MKVCIWIVVKQLIDKNKMLLNADVFLINKQIFIFFMTFRIQTRFALFKLEKLDGISTNP